MSNYDVLVQPDGRYWYVQVPAIERSTQAKGLDDIEPMAKDLITVMNDDDNPELKVTFVLPKQAKQHVTEMFRQREIAKKPTHKRLPNPDSPHGPYATRDSRIDKSELYWGSPTNEHFNWSTAKQSTKRQRPNRLSQQLNHAPHARTMPHRYRLRSRLSERVHKAQTVSASQAQEHQAGSSHPSRLRRSSLVRVAMEAGASVRALAPVPASSASKEASVNWRASSLLVC